MTKKNQSKGVKRKCRTCNFTTNVPISCPICRLEIRETQEILNCHGCRAKCHRKCTPMNRTRYRELKRENKLKDLLCDVCEDVGEMHMHTWCEKTTDSQDKAARKSVGEMPGTSGNCEKRESVVSHQKKNDKQNSTDSTDVVKPQDKLMETTDNEKHASTDKPVSEAEGDINDAAQTGLSEENSDDDDVVLRKPKKSEFTPEQALDVIIQDPSDESDQDDTPTKKKRVKRPVADSSSDEDENVSLNDTVKNHTANGDEDNDFCPPFTAIPLLTGSSPTEGRHRGSKCSTDCANFPNPGLVAKTVKHGLGATVCLATSGQNTIQPETSKKTTPTKTDAVRRFQDIRAKLICDGLPEDAADLILSSWQPATTQQYFSYYKKWMQFCNERKINHLAPDMNQVIAFLTFLYKNGLKYSGLNSARSALSSILEITSNCQIGKHILTKRLLKAIFIKEPPLPRYKCTWDTGKVLRYLQSLGSSAHLDLVSLSLKLVTLLALTTGQRCQTIFLIDIRNIDIENNSVKFRIGDLLKQSNSKNHLEELFIEKYKPDDKLCVVHTLKTYLECTESLRQTSQLFISCQKPFKAVTKSTIARWVKTMLKNAGINMDIFKPHSVRSASCSTAVKNVPIDTVLRTAGWSSACTFRTYYNRPITNDSSFSKSVLDSVSK